MSQTEKRLPFKHNGRDLEVIATPEDGKWRVRVYENEKPITRAIYYLAFDTEIDARMMGHHDDLLDSLIGSAKDDVTSERAALL